MGAPARIIQSEPIFAVHATDPRERAVTSYLEVRRRRRTRGLIDTAADAAMAGGGLLLANAAMHLGMGLPEGRNGLALGGMFLASGIIWLTRLVHQGGDRKDPAQAARLPALVALEAEAA